MSRGVLVALVIGLVLTGCEDGQRSTPTRTPPPSTQSPTPPPEVRYVTAPALNVREGPGTEYAVVGSLRCGDRVTVLEWRGAWLRISQGWIHGDYTSATRPPCSTPTPTVTVPPTTQRCDYSGDTRAVIKGNISYYTGERIYHTPSGSASSCYPCTVIDTGKGERWFCTEAEARAAGWRASRAPPGCCD